MMAWLANSTGWRWRAILSLTFLLVLFVNPIGYVGGGSDDWQYLSAARCWVQHGPCLPATHWAGRWPVFAPIAAIIGLIGETRTTIGLWPLVASIASIALLAVIGNRLWGPPIGWLASLLFLMTPAFAIQILEPSVEALELAFILSGMLCISWWMESRSTLTAFFAGLSLALAFQVRETSLVAILIAAALVATKKPRMIDVAAAGIGFVAPMAIEMLAYGIITGDPFFRRALSIAHTQIPSSELLGPIDTQSWPFFNKSYIANWRHESGLHIHWLVDGFLNLFVNAKTGLLLLLAPPLLLFTDSRGQAERRVAIRLFGLAILYMAILIYALAIDPKARVMFVPLAATSLAVSVLIIRLFRSGRRLLPAVAVAGHLLIGIVVLFTYPRTYVFERPAARWIAERPGQIEIDDDTRTHLALVGGAAELPGLRSGRPYWLHVGKSGCSNRSGGSVRIAGPMRVVAEIPASRLSAVDTPALCLFRSTTSGTTPR